MNGSVEPTFLQFPGAMFEDAQSNKAEAPPEIMQRRRVTREYVLRRDYVESSTESEKMKAIEDMVKKLEYNIKSTQAENDGLNAMLSIKEQDYLMDLEGEKKKTAEAEERAIYHYKQSEKATETLAMIKNAHAEEINILQMQVEKKDEELGSIHRELQCIKSSLYAEESERKRREVDADNSLAPFKQRIAELEQQVLAQGEQIMQSLDREKELISKLSHAEGRVTELEDAKFDTDKMRVLDEQIQRHNRRALDLDKENRELTSELKHYKEIYQNADSLRNEKVALERQIQDMGNLREQVLLLDIENARLKKERLDWAGYLEANDGADFETPHGLIFRLTQGRESARLASEQLERVKKDMVEKDEMISTLSDHVDELTRTMQERDKSIASSRFAISMLEKDVSMMKRHVNLLEEQLKLYDLEESNYMTNYDAQKTERIGQLEALLKEVEERVTVQTQDTLRQEAASNEHVSSAETEPRPLQLPTGVSLSQFLHKLSDDKVAAIQELNTLQAEQAICRTELRLAKEQIHIVMTVIDRHKLGKADIAQTDQTIPDMSSTEDEGHRILKLKDSPASRLESMHQNQVDYLREENVSLLKLVQDLQSGSGGDGPTGKKRKADDTPDGSDGSMMTIPRSSLRNKDDEIEGLQTDLAKKQKRIKRLIQVWESNLKYYNDVICELFGYSVDVDFPADSTLADSRTDVKIKLYSTFVKRSDLSFQFDGKKDAKGTLVTLGDFKMSGKREGEYWELLKNTYDTYVNQRECIPAFLSATALELQESTTDYRKEPLEKEVSYEDVDEHEKHYAEDYIEPELEDYEDTEQEKYADVEQEDYDQAEQEGYDVIEQASYGQEEQDYDDHEMQEGYDEEELEDYDQEAQQEYDDDEDEATEGWDYGTDGLEEPGKSEFNAMNTDEAEDDEDAIEEDEEEEEEDDDENENDEEGGQPESPSSVYIIDDD